MRRKTKPVKTERIKRNYTRRPKPEVIEEDQTSGDWTPVEAPPAQDLCKTPGCKNPLAEGQTHVCKNHVRSN